MARNPKILVAPGPYKECLTAPEVTDAMCDGIESVAPHLSLFRRPMSDGGSGIATLLAKETGGRLVDITVADPLGRPISAAYAILGDGKTAVIESAQACGLALVQGRDRNPLRTSSFGVGELILHAAQQVGVTDIILGCGDSSTNDCGIGMAAALGVEFEGIQDVRFPAGEHLSMIQAVRPTLHPALREKQLTVACNLTSVLEGPEGTSRIYGPQKGANAEDIERLEQGVSHFCRLLFSAGGADLSYLPGAGGAGGLAASAYAFVAGRLLYSIDVIDRYVGLDSMLSKVDIVLTGEGMIDDRTATGKVACGIALKAKKFGIPVIAIVGAIGKSHQDIFYNGIDSIFAIQDGPMSFEASTRNAKFLIRETTAHVVRLLTTVS